MLTDIEQVIREYVPEVAHLSLATTVNGAPWICELHFAYDDALNLYFATRPNRRHSLEIEQNKQVAGSIVKQHSEREKVRGVFFEGTVKAITNQDERATAYRLFTERFGVDVSLAQSPAAPSERTLYVIAVNKFYVFDSIASEKGEKYELAWIQ